MNEYELTSAIEEGLSTRQLGERFGCSQTNIRYWLKKFNLKTKVLTQKDSRVCPKCKVKKDLTMFYCRRGKPGTSTYCKPCTITQTKDRQKAFKRLCVEYKGGKCSSCGYFKCIGALEFHHTDPSKKEFTISRRKGFSLNQAVKDELDKCTLLCANCHREAHELL